MTNLRHMPHARQLDNRMTPTHKTYNAYPEAAFTTRLTYVRSRLTCPIPRKGLPTGEG